jgi:Asp-tRNA(Asn)/Glu-tRNA(Gln) amidotransferase A subunit family amidase
VARIDPIEPVSPVDPARKSEAGLPVGLQIVGPRFREDRVLAAAAAVERARPWEDDYPP